MATIEFIERDHFGQAGDTIAVLHNEFPVFIEGDEVEIEHKEYTIIHMHTIVSITPPSITYQVHVRRNPS